MFDLINRLIFWDENAWVSGDDEFEDIIDKMKILSKKINGGGK